MKYKVILIISQLKKSFFKLISRFLFRKKEEKLLIHTYTLTHTRRKNSNFNQSIEINLSKLFEVCVFNLEEWEKNKRERKKKVRKKTRDFNERKKQLLIIFLKKNNNQMNEIYWIVSIFFFWNNTILTLVRKKKEKKRIWTKIISNIFVFLFVVLFWWN